MDRTLPPALVTAFVPALVAIGSVQRNTAVVAAVPAASLRSLQATRLPLQLISAILVILRLDAFMIFIVGCYD